MPPAVPIVVAGLASGVSVGLTAAGALTVGFSTSAFVVGAALAAVSTLATSKPSSGSFDAFKSQGSTQQFRQPVTERRIIYGESRESGPILFVGLSDDNEFLHMVIAVASHEVEEIGELIIGEVSVTDDMLDADGLITEGRYANVIRIKKHLGTVDQLADPDLVAEVPAWTSNHRLRETAYLYIRLKWDANKFPTGIPNISAWVKGRKCLDTRDSVVRYTTNTALIANNYLTDERFGFGASQDIVDSAQLNATANTCDEFVTTQSLPINISSIDGDSDIVTLSGDRLQFQTGDRIRLTSGTVGGLSSGVDYYVIAYQRLGTPRIKISASLADALAGTAIDLDGIGDGILAKNAEPRFHGGGILRADSELGGNLNEILLSMAGRAVYAGGSWKIIAGEYQTPVYTFGPSDLVGEISVSSKVSVRERFNRVQGVYTSPLNDGNPSDYPLVKNDTYTTQDGKDIKYNLDLPFTQRPHTAQRLAKIALERMRQEIIFSADFKLTAFKVGVGDNIFFDFPRYGWGGKVFEVTSWTLNSSDGVPKISMTLRENASAVYDWNSGEETAVDPAPNTTLPNPFDVAPPTALNVVPREIRTANGDFTYEFLVGWTPPVDSFVINGGSYEVQFRRSENAEWATSFDAKGGDTSITVKQVNPGVNYDVRIRSVNYLGVKSDYNNLFGFTVDSPSGATIAIDYGFTKNATSDTIDYRFTTESSADDQIDYGETI